MLGGLFGQMQAPSGGLLGALAPEDRQGALWNALGGAGAAILAANQPRVGPVGPTFAGLLGAGAQGFAQGAEQGAAQAMAAQQFREQRGREGDFRAAAGEGDDGALTPQQRSLRQLMGGNRAAFAAMGPQAGMGLLAQSLNRQPAAPMNVGPGGAVVDPATGRVIFQAPFAPRAPQVVGSAETGYFLLNPDAGGGGAGGGGGGNRASGAPPAPAPAGMRYGGPAAALPDNRDDPNYNPAQGSAARVAAVGAPLVNPASTGPNSAVPGWDAGLRPPSGVINPLAGMTPLIPPRAPERWEPVPTPQGETGQWQRSSRTGQLQRVGGGNGVTVNNNPGESSFERARGTAIAEEEQQVRAGAQQAFNTLSRLSTIERNLENFRTGRLSETSLTVGQIAGRLGVPAPVLSGLGLAPDQVASGEAIRSTASQLLLGMIGPGGFPAQNFSNADREMLERALPSLQNSPDGNRVIVQIMRATAERQRDLARSWNEFRRDNPGAEGFLRWQADVMPNIVNRDVLGGFLEPYATPMSNPAPGAVAPPSGGPAAAERPANLPSPRSAAEMQRLAPGARFVAPDGTIRTVPAR